MSDAVFYCTLGVLAFSLGIAQLLSMKLDNSRVFVRCDLDMALTEPDEIVTLRYQIQNRGWWPLLFVNVSFSFDKDVEIREDEAWRKAYCTKNDAGSMCSIRLSLMPRRMIRGKIRISFRNRGVHRVGRVYVETSDFLGFRSKTRSADMQQDVVCTARFLPECASELSYAGFLGDISARRFILDDPSLVLGYRDYTGAEPMKSIAWNQTARSGRLMVKNHDYTVDVDVAILVNEEYCDEAVAEYCLAMLRTTCDRLERDRIPYAVISNGDLRETEKGVGRTHCFEIQRRIGRSHFFRYRDMDQCTGSVAGSGITARGWIVIAPRQTQELQAAISRLETSSGGTVCLLTGEGARVNV